MMPSPGVLKPLVLSPAAAEEAAGTSDARRPARALGTAAVQSVLGVPKL